MTVTRRDGVRSLYSGYTTTLTMNIPFQAMYLHHLFLYIHHSYIYIYIYMDVRGPAFEASFIPTDILQVMRAW